jgi:hypothetical protein
MCCWAVAQGLELVAHNALEFIRPTLVRNGP